MTAGERRWMDREQERGERAAEKRAFAYELAFWILIIIASAVLAIAGHEKLCLTSFTSHA